MTKPTLVLEIGAEGGCIRVFRDTAEPTPGSLFCATLLDQTPLLLDETGGGGSEIRRKSGWVNWEEAMIWIGRYPWPCLVALQVDLAVANNVWDAATARMRECITPVSGRSLERWRKLCNRPDGLLPHKVLEPRPRSASRAAVPPPARPPSHTASMPADPGATQTRISTTNRQTLLQELIARGKNQGYLTYAQLNAGLPSEIVDPEQIEDIVNTITDMGMPVRES